MFVKEMVIDGFKSYGQRTEIKGFDHQFNAITGLNGYVEKLGICDLVFTNVIFLQVRKKQHSGCHLLPPRYHQLEPRQSSQPAGTGLQERPGWRHQGDSLHHLRQQRQEAVSARIRALR